MPTVLVQHDLSNNRIQTQPNPMMFHKKPYLRVDRGQSRNPDVRVKKNEKDLIALRLIKRLGQFAADTIAITIETYTGDETDHDDESLYDDDSERQVEFHQNEHGPNNGYNGYKIADVIQKQVDDHGRPWGIKEDYKDELKDLDDELNDTRTEFLSEDIMSNFHSKLGKFITEAVSEEERINNSIETIERNLKQLKNQQLETKVRINKIRSMQKDLSARLASQKSLSLSIREQILNANDEISKLRHKQLQLQKHKR